MKAEERYGAIKTALARGDELAELVTAPDRRIFPDALTALEEIRRDLSELQEMQDLKGLYAEAIRTQTLAQAASTKDLEAKRAAEVEYENERCARLDAIEYAQQLRAELAGAVETLLKLEASSHAD